MYVPKPLDTSGVILPDEIEELSEMLAKNVHEVWAANRLSEGWVCGEERNDKNKTHPCLTEYENLPEIEKDYDRRTMSETLKAIYALGFRIEKNTE